jgi:hypothetical protein
LEAGIVAAVLLGGYFFKGGECRGLRVLPGEFQRVKTLPTVAEGWEFSCLVSSASGIVAFAGQATGSVAADSYLRASKETAGRPGNEGCARRFGGASFGVDGGMG